MSNSRNSTSQKVATSLFCLIGLILNGKIFAAEISGIRFWQDPEKTRVVLDLGDKVNYKVFTLANPTRLVIDVHQSQLKFDLSTLNAPTNLVSKIRSSKQPEKTRIVFDLKKTVSTKDFTLAPFQSFGHRLVIDLRSPESKKRIVKHVENSDKEDRDIIIVIDAGHGGEDPGAPGGEKQVCLAVAKRIANLINSEKGMKAIMTRSGDYFVELKKRTEITRKNKADLFVSLHADGFTDKRVRGTAVWVLSPKGANSEIGRWLEQREKASDLAGGVDISHQDPMVAQVLMDLTMSYSLGESLKAGDLVRDELKKKMPKMHGKAIKKGNFSVLRMPDIPAMMVEMGFISNRAENRLLKSTKHQKKISNAVFQGVRRYFKANAPEGTLYRKLAQIKSYKVTSGDTLSQIAQRYGTTTKVLKQQNNLTSDRLRIGQVITIPGA